MIIYKITNLVNGKLYIGQHNGKRRNYLGGGKILKSAIIKYGKENFKKEIIIDNVNSQEELDKLEKYYIKFYSSTITENGYNIQKGGRGYKNNSISSEQREKTRQRMLGNKIMNGRKLEEETRLKQSISHREQLKNISKEELHRRWEKGRQIRESKYDMRKLISEGRQKNKKTDWNNKQTKPVIQETEGGKFIKLWASAYQVQKEEGWTSSRISAVCNNIYGCKTYRKYKWRFANVDETVKHTCGKQTCKE